MGKILVIEKMLFEGNFSHRGEFYFTHWRINKKGIGLLKIKRIREKDGYYKDRFGNRWSTKLFTKEQAHAAAQSLIECVDCLNCVDCQYCDGCQGCRHCDHCLKCTDCISCNYCENCIKCNNCNGCIKSQKCTRCENCFYCVSMVGEIMRNFQIKGVTA